MPLLLMWIIKSVAGYFSSFLKLSHFFFKYCFGFIYYCYLSKSPTIHVRLHYCSLCYSLLCIYIYFYFLLPFWIFSLNLSSNSFSFHLSCQTHLFLLNFINLYSSPLPIFYVVFYHFIILSIIGIITSYRFCLSLFLLFCLYVSLLCINGVFFFLLSVIE